MSIKLTEAGKNIKNVLKDKFPLIPFSVRQTHDNPLAHDNYVNIKWKDGPAEKLVYDILKHNKLTGFNFQREFSDQAIIAESLKIAKEHNVTIEHLTSSSDFYKDPFVEDCIRTKLDGTRTEYPQFDNIGVIARKGLKNKSIF